MSQSKAKPTKWPVCPAKTQIRSAWASVQSDPAVRSKSLLCTLLEATDINLVQVDNEDSDQTGRMPRLIWVFAGRTGQFSGFVLLPVRLKYERKMQKCRNCSLSRTLSFSSYVKWEYHQVPVEFLALEYSGWHRHQDLASHLSPPTMVNIKTKPTKWPVCPAKTQISLGIRPVWSEPLLSTWRNLWSLATYLTHSGDSDQTVWMRRLIWVLAGCRGHFVGFVVHWLN